MLYEVITNVATVTITVTAENDPPTANPQSVSTVQNTALAITLTGSDVEGSPLTYAIVSGPTHGTLTGAAPNVTYTPAASYNGPDSFTFKVNDGTLDSAPATVSIVITSYSIHYTKLYDEYSSRINHTRVIRVLAAWHELLSGTDLFTGESFNLDFHSVRNNFV